LKSSGSRVEGAWLADEGLHAIIGALERGGAKALIVGGAVRDALLGRPVRDVDIATPEAPATVIERLQAAKIKAVPTGIDHGTITAVMSGRPFEITTLRRDVTTDGRRAVVAFTDDWAADAARRDFTMNALYCDLSGNVFDPTGMGVEDARAGRIRFIGNAGERLSEDYLRLLRFFRFHAHFGKGKVDNRALEACSKVVDKLGALSGERIWLETKKLLSAPDPTETLGLMAAAGVDVHLFPGGVDRGRLSRLIVIEARLAESDPIRRLSALRFGYSNEALAERLRLSNEEKERFLALSAPQEGLSADLEKGAARALIYGLGARRFRDHVLIYEAGDDNKRASEPWRKLCALSEAWRPPEFPIRGADVLDAGAAPGKEVGRLLHDLEGWWIDQDFAPDRAALLRELARRMAGRQK